MVVTAGDSMLFKCCNCIAISANEQEIPQSNGIDRQPLKVDSKVRESRVNNTDGYLLTCISSVADIHRKMAG